MGIFALVVFLMSGSTYGADPGDIDSLIIEGQKKIQKGVDSWDLAAMLRARAYFERLLADSTYPWLVHYYIGYADLRLVTRYYSEQNGKERALEFLEDGIQHLKQSIELKEDFAEAYSLLSSLYGQKISFKPYMAMFLGPKAGKYKKRAFELAPENPRVYLIAGQSAYFTPKLFGGGKDKAIAHFQKAIHYFGLFKPGSPILPSWGHEEAYAWLGKVQMERGDYEAAERNFQKALEINPHFGWVRYVLMKELERRKAEDAGDRQA